MKIYIKNEVLFYRVEETTLETPEIYFHIFYFVHDQFTGRTRNDQKARRQARARPRIISSMKNYILKTLNTKKTRWKHLLYISNRFFIDGSS